MYSTNSRAERDRGGTRSGGWRGRGSRTLLTALACLAGFGCLAGFVITVAHRAPLRPAARALPTALSLPTARPSAASAPVAGSATASGPRLGAVSWPADGVSAASVSGYGVTDGPGATRQVPIASVAKLMTAYVILRDHPLPAGGSGPGITVEPSEAAGYPAQAADGDSLVAVAAGEAITERQALEALLLPSADNMAWILARWDAGGEAAFAARMNAAARSLGMTGTR